MWHRIHFLYMQHLYVFRTAGLTTEQGQDLWWILYLSSDISQNSNQHFYFVTIFQCLLVHCLGYCYLCFSFITILGNELVILPGIVFYYGIVLYSALEHATDKIQDRAEINKSLHFPEFLISLSLSRQGRRQGGSSEPPFWQASM